MSATQLGGCTPVEPAKLPVTDYVTEHASTALEYNLYLNEEISVITNILTSRMGMALSVADGTCSAESEIRNTEEDLLKMEEVKNSLTGIMPAKTYETDRQNVLDITEEITDALREYKGYLETGDNDGMRSSRDIFCSLFKEIIGEANTCYY